MCIIGIAYRCSPHFSLMVCANRDENHQRPTADANWWADQPDTLGGRDLQAGGTWLGVNRKGRFAAVTNISAPEQAVAAAPRSRGSLISTFLNGTTSAKDTATALATQSAEYGPFNLLLFDGCELRHVSSLTASTRLGPGVHAFSNAPAGTEWPKITQMREGLAALVDETLPTNALLGLLSQTRSAEDGWQARHTSLFQKNPQWGTRCSTVVLAGTQGNMYFTERRFKPDGSRIGTDHYAFRMM